MDNQSSPRRERLRMASHDASERTASKTATSKYSIAMDRGSGVVGLGCTYPVSNSGFGNRCWACMKFPTITRRRKNTNMRVGIFFIISAFLPTYKISFDDIRLIGRNPADGVRGTCTGNGALVTIQTEVVADLQLKRSVPECSTSLYALGTTDAELFINDIFKKGLLDINFR